LVVAAEKRFKDMTAERSEEISRTILLGLPGTVDDMSLADFQRRLDEYREIDSNQLRANLGKFLSYIIPVAKECGVALAIHPDDPPFSIFGLPRIASTESDFDQLLKLVDEFENGITFCAGSLGALPMNHLPKLFKKYASRVHFLHLRNVQLEMDGSFYEADHLAGSTNMAALMFEIVKETKLRDDVGLKRIPMRPDHGHRMLGDLDRSFYAGYSAVGRLKGLAELRGLEAGIRYMLK
jgi:mannonate dehydratase